ncbi:hypothetical protein KA001_02850 [Patescibacteria group bacterium]|nr:hypothetical protein [Patescibacteria group bacterium]
MTLNFLFKDVTIFSDVNVGFYINFPKKFWKYKRINENEFCFLKKNTKSAIIMSIFDDKIYTYENIKENEYFIETKLGNYPAYVTCKLFSEFSELQYEWYFIDNNKKIVFYYSIQEKASDLEKDFQYNNVLAILNTIAEKNKKNV